MASTQSSKKTNTRSKNNRPNVSRQAVAKRKTKQKKRSQNKGTDRTLDHTSNHEDETNEEDDTNANKLNTRTQSLSDAGLGDDSDSSPENSVDLTLDNFKSQLQNWLVNQLRQAVQKNKSIQTPRIPSEIQDALVLLQQNYIKSKLMLALIGNVKGRVNQCANRVVRIEGWDERNGHLGEAWASLSPNEKAVFSPPIFACLSKIPYRISDEEDDENEEINLTEEEKELYEPLYKNLVNHKKVALLISKGSDSTTTQSSIFKQAERSLTKLNLGVSPQFEIIPQ
ncbi:hypothetical protein PCANC_11340 [Puccinia coronata f. sp. avenae]|uniref:Uncharacterized protein n=1 Tax=Puccinia coronata f. sp. avenae TaxID=200324 RepID=A0A2N5VT05_9BASI|nr:hypothetical protein PCANC_11340 [Puccinia coronata f. sp. avenae]